MIWNGILAEGNSPQRATYRDITQRKQCTYKRNTLAPSCNHYGGKEVRITYSRCVSAALAIQDARHMCRVIVISVMYSYTIILHIVLQNATISGKRHLNTKCVFWFSVQLLSEHFWFYKKCNKFDLRSYREIDVITSKACVVLLITQAIASRNGIMTVDRT